MTYLETVYIWFGDQWPTRWEIPPTVTKVGMGRHYTKTIFGLPAVHICSIVTLLPKRTSWRPGLNLIPLDLYWKSNQKSWSVYIVAFPILLNCWLQKFACFISSKMFPKCLIYIHNIITHATCRIHCVLLIDSQTLQCIVVQRLSEGLYAGGGGGG